MTTHTEILNYITKQKGFTDYLELGTQYGVNFNAVTCRRKDGVDPDLKPGIVASYKMTSDRFFASMQPVKVYDLIFIDADHTAKQVAKDFINSMKFLKPDGFIVLHDTNPDRQEIATEVRNTKEWTGNVWEFIACLRADFVTLPFDYGITVVRAGTYRIALEEKPDWAEFDARRQHWLRLVNVEEFKAWL